MHPSIVGVSVFVTLRHSGYIRRKNLIQYYFLIIKNSDKKHWNSVKKEKNRSLDTLYQNRGSDLEKSLILIQMHLN